MSPAQDHRPPAIPARWDQGRWHNARVLDGSKKADSLTPPGTAKEQAAKARRLGTLLGRRWRAPGAGSDPFGYPVWAKYQSSDPVASLLIARGAIFTVKLDRAPQPGAHKREVDNVLLLCGEYTHLTEVFVPGTGLLLHERERGFFGEQGGPARRAHPDVVLLAARELTRQREHLALPLGTAEVDDGVGAIGLVLPQRSVADIRGEGLIVGIDGPPLSARVLDPAATAEVLARADAAAGALAQRLRERLAPFARSPVEIPPDWPKTPVAEAFAAAGLIASILCSYKTEGIATATVAALAALGVTATVLSSYDLPSIGHRDLTFRVRRADGTEVKMLRSLHQGDAASLTLASCQEALDLWFPDWSAVFAAASGDHAVVGLVPTSLLDDFPELAAPEQDWILVSAVRD